MTKTFKNITTFGLAFTFIFASVFCCCMTQNVEAKETVSACHQTGTDKQASPTPQGEDCDCEEIASTIHTKVKADIKFAKSDFSTINSSPQLTQAVLLTASYQAPPGVVDQTTPLYLKNSTLRL